MERKKEKTAPDGKIRRKEKPMRMEYSGNELTKEAQAVADDIADRCDTEIECWNAIDEYAAQSVENKSVAEQIKEYCTFIQDEPGKLKRARYAHYTPGISVRIEASLPPEEIVTVDEFLDFVSQEHPHSITCIIENKDDLDRIKAIAVNSEYY